MDKEIETLDIDWYEPGVEDKIGQCQEKINEIIDFLNKTNEKQQ